MFKHVILHVGVIPDALPIAHAFQRDGFTGRVNIARAIGAERPLKRRLYGDKKCICHLVSVNMAIAVIRG